MNRNKVTKNNTMKKLMKKGTALGLCAMLAAGSFGAINTATAEGTLLMKAEAGEEQTERVRGWLDVSDVVEEAMPSVVSITTKSVREVQNYYGTYGFGFGYIPETTEREVEIGGSGIIIGQNETEFLIATNYHVVEDANEVTVTFADGESYEAKAKGYDEDRDLAVVAVDIADIKDDTMEAIKVAKIGSSDDLRVGEQVVAIGNALGYGQSVTTGIVSAKNRRLDDTYTGDEVVNLIQTDAAINYGNSGGALLNMAGEVVGINSAKMASAGIEGMCYAISISDVADVLEKLMNEVVREKVEGKHGVLGITGRTVTDDLRMYYGMPQGVYVIDVTEDGGADKAGIKKNYIITEFDGKDINTIDRLVELLTYYEPGEEVEVEVKYISDGEYESKIVTVVLGEDTSEEDNNEKHPEIKKREDRDSKDKEPEDNDSDKDDSEEETTPDGDDDMNSYFGGDDLEDFFFGNLFGGYGNRGDYEENYDSEDGGSKDKGSFWN